MLLKLSINLKRRFLTLGILLLLFSNHQQGYSQCDGPFDSCVTPCGNVEVSQVLRDRGIGNCDPRGDAFISNDCLAPLKKVLSKPIRMSHLERFIRHPSNWEIPNSPCLEDLDGDNIPEACTVEPHECHSSFCPERYADEIEMLADLNATFIFEAFHTWGDQHQIRPGSHIMNAACQIVKDINAAYDCKGQRRPIIQASILNFIGPNLDQYRLEIPQCVQDAFGVTLRPNAEFLRSEIVHDDEGFWDVTKLQAQMWVYYNAMMYIDAGYNALHMGMVGIFGEHDNLKDPFNRLPETAKLFEMIRCYAESKGGFVLISGEHLPPEIDFYHGNIADKNLIFDFDNIPLRVREISDTINYCPGDVSGGLPGFNLVDGPCASEPYAAYLDTCIVNQWRHLEGGISPRGCEYEVVPYVIAFDFSCGVGNSNFPQGVPIQGFDGGVYNWDDMNWFVNKISRECAADFMQSIICGISDISNGHGSIQLPGTIIKRNCEEQPDWSYRISQDDLVFDAIKNDAWIMDDDLEIVSVKQCLNPTNSLICNGEIILPSENATFIKSIEKHTFSVKNPDCVSTYSWHIYNITNGVWLPLTYGTSRSIVVDRAANYRISLRQDNANLLPFGSKSVSIEEYMTPRCCEKVLLAPNNGNDDGQLNVNLFPNPAGQQFNIKLNLAREDRLFIDLLDSYGSIVRQLESGTNYSVGETQKNYDISSLSEGVYVVRVTESNGQSTALQLVKTDSAFSE